MTRVLMSAIIDERATPATIMPDGEATAVRVIRPRAGWQPVNLGELWRYRELLGFLVWRDIKVRYKQSVMGAAWAIIQPVSTMIVFTVFFGRFGGMAQHVSIPYPVFAYAGLLAWTYFSGAVGQAGNSLVSSASMIRKVYFPRLIIPLAACGVGLIDFAVACLVMAGLMIWYGVAPTPQIILFPLFLGLTVVTAVGVGTLLSALTIAYRDFRYVLGFLTQLWMFASPVAYPLEVVPEKYRLIYAINPMVGALNGFRASLLGTGVNWGVVGVSAASSAVALAVGLLYFRRVERRFADIA